MVDGVPAGFVLYSPPLYTPRRWPSPPRRWSADAVLLMTAHIIPEFSGGGLGRMLIQGVAKDLTRRGVKALKLSGISSGKSLVRRSSGILAFCGV
ncbi:hypothetical protein GCM10020220_105070 [Nonomuraea rubra]|uniref:hypothetical protein n=1 Tax=Nonomuraea rubra TaxID=46180 RepID=UPI0031ED0C1C